jgi:hypothetical protein
VSLIGSHDKNARDIWRTLEITHEGTKMTILTNSLDALGRTYTNVDIMSKILRPLLKTRKAKVIVI